MAEGDYLAGQLTASIGGGLSRRWKNVVFQSKDGSPAKLYINTAETLDITLNAPASPDSKELLLGKSGACFSGKVKSILFL